MNKLLFVSFLFLGQLLVAQTTHHHYDLKVAGFSIGNLEATKEIKGNRIQYIADSEGIVRFLGTHSVKTHLEAVYENGELISSKNQLWEDGELTEKSAVKKVGSQYKIKVNDQESIIHQPITFSSIMLYFQAPTQVKKVFFEPDAVFRTVEKLKQDNYGLTNSANATNTYKYNVEGKLEKATFEAGWFDVSIVLK